MLVKALKAAGIAVLVGISSSSFAQSLFSNSSNELCSANYLQGCESLETNACLKKYYACGHYEDIIQHFSAEQISTSPQAHYYKGVSYYGLFNRSRANSVRCHFSKVGRLELMTYIKKQQSEGFNVIESFNQAYHASQSYEALSAVEGCEESALLKEEVELLTELYAEKTLGSLFAGPVSNGALGSTVAALKKDIQTAISGFVTKASAVETQLQMRETALAMSQTRLESIVDRVNEDFGQADIQRNGDGQITGVTASFSTSSAFRAAQINAANWKQQVVNKETEIYGAMNATSISDYEAARSEIINRAVYVTQASTAHINLSGNFVNSTKMSDLYNLANGTEMGQSAEAIINSMGNTWANSNTGSVDCLFLFPQPWYCDPQNRGGLLNSFQM